MIRDQRFVRVDRMIKCWFRTFEQQACIERSDVVRYSVKVKEESILKTENRFWWTFSS